MEMTNYTREEINTAIFEVLTHQFKKDAKEAHRIVEAVGYKVEKWDGSFEVTNTETNRYLKYEESTYYYNKGTLRMISGNKRCKTIEDLKSVDFVGQLETTRKVYNEPYYYGSEAYFKYHNIEHNDDMVERYDGYIKQTLEKIASLQEDLIYYTTNKVKCEAKARNLRKEYGLKK